MLRQVSGARRSYYVYPFGMMSTTGRASQMALMVKNLPVSAGDVKRHGFDPWIRKIHWRRTCRPLDESQTEEPGGTWSIGLQRVGHNRSNSAHTYTRTGKSTESRWVAEGALRRSCLTATELLLGAMKMFWN